MEANRKIESLQICRAIAALLVVLCHFSVDVKYFLGYDLLHSFFLFGRQGVTFFFVLSGFIISYVHWDDINTGYFKLNNYFFKRFTRIFPSYWPILIIITLLFLFFGSYSGREINDRHINYIEFIKNFFLIKYDGNLIVLVAWTLEYEILFYLFFSLYIIHAKTANIILLAWLTLIAIFNLGFFSFNPGFFKFLLSINCVQFIAGCLSAYIIKKWSHLIKIPRFIFLMGTFGFLCCGIVEDYYLFYFNSKFITELFAFFSALIILGLVKIESNRSIKYPKYVLFLGGASYSLYLIHRTILSVLFRISQYISFHQYPFTRFCFLTIFVLGGTVFLACLYYKFYEIPIIHFLRRRKPILQEFPKLYSRPN